MSDKIQILMSSDAGVIYVLIGLMLALMLAILVIDRKTKKKNKMIEAEEEISKETSTAPVLEQQVPIETPDIEMLLEVEEPVKQEPIEMLVPQEEKKETVVSAETSFEMAEPTSQVTVPIQPVQEEIKYVDESLEQTKAQLELAHLAEELKKAEEVTQNIDLTNFELEQEENAIISLEEFLKKGDTLYDQNELTQYKDEGNEPINLQELEARFQETRQEEVQDKKTVVLENFIEEETEKIKLPMNTEERKFKSSPVISPIYGIAPQPVEKPESIQLENTANYDKLDEEIRKTNEFLQILKELQKKLD